MEDPSIPLHFREYEVLSLLGKGGMGKVYKARHIYLDEERAIKVIHRSFWKQDELRESVDRFIHEARVLTKLRHPNLVLLHDFGTLEENTFFMVMEYINGESALSRLRRLERIPIDESLRIIREAALGLHCAHQQGIVHRDISPDNLLIVKQSDSREVTKVIDFGIAKTLFGKTLTKVGLFMGKPQYSSPEQLTEGEDVDHRADIYSLGATLYHMVTGALPFEGKNLIEVIRKVVKGPPPPPSSHFPSGHFPKALDRVILKAMLKDPNHRYSSMEQLIVDLAEIISPDLTSVTDAHAQFLNRVNHEMRTRLNVIIGYSEMLAEDASQAGNRYLLEDLNKISSAGKHLLWYMGSDDLPEGDQTVTHWDNLRKARHYYDKMEWEQAIEYWHLALDETSDKKMVLQWLVAAEARLDTERQIRKQLTAQLKKCNLLLDEKRLVDVRAVMDDAERNLSSSYRLKDLKQQWFGLLKRLKVEIEEVLREHNAGKKAAALRDEIPTSRHHVTEQVTQETIQEPPGPADTGEKV